MAAIPAREGGSINRGETMRRRVARRISHWALLLLLPPLASPGPLAQERPPAPPAPRAAQETGAAPEGAPAEAIVLSLADCLKAALENNLDIAVARYDPLKSETSVTLQHAAFDPTLTGSATSREAQERRISSFIGEFSSFDKVHDYQVSLLDPLVIGGSYRIDVSALDTENQTTNVFGSTSSTGFNTAWSLTYTQSLLRNLGPRTQRWQIVVARNTLGVSESQFRQTVMDTIGAAEQAYWDLNFALMDLRTKRASLQLAKDFLEQNRIKVRVGTLAPIEITQAEAGVADREEGVIVAENAVRTAEDALRRIMNVPADSPLWSRPVTPADEPPLVEVTAEMAAAVAAAESGRPDLEQARLTLRTRETELAHYRNQKRWDLVFEGAYGVLGFDEFTYNTSIDDLRDRNQDNWRLSLSLSVPVGNRLAVANYTNAEHALSQARYDLQRLEQLARVEVRNAVRTVETNLKRVRAAQVNTRLQREKLDAEQKKFENGMSTSFQVLQFQTDLSTAESRENQAIVDYNKSQVDLERVKGTLLQAKGIVMPGDAGGAPAAGAGSASAALRGLWRRAAAGGAAGDRFGLSAAAGDALWAGATGGGAFRVGAAEVSERVTLPTSFLFDGRRLVGIGGSGAGGPAPDAEGGAPAVSAGR
jgi:outer membrane protein TolC